MDSTMRTVIAREPGRVELVEAPVPRPGPGEVLLRIRRCGICGSDLHWYHGQLPAPPACPGHEISAVVAGLGHGVSGFAEGDRVTVEGIRACGRCKWCLTADYQRCLGLQIVGMTVAGGFADYMIAAPRHLFPVPDSVDDDAAQLTEPLAVSVHAVRLARLEIGQRVLVLGAGTIGLTAIAAARAGGAGEILVTARRPQQRAAALALGATEVLDPADSGALGALGFERPADVVLETVGGDGATLTQAIPCTRPGGTIAVLGVFTTMPPLNALLLMARELRLIGSMCYGRADSRADFEIALDLLHREAGLLRETLLTHRVGLDHIDEGFRLAADKASGSIKVGIHVSDS